MSNNIDERVVSMKFDNATFEQRVSNTMSTIEKLKSKLNFGAQAKSFDDVNAAANNVNLSGMASALDNISSKFSVMGAVAFSVINNIVSKAMTAGAQIVKSFAIGPVMDGFREYETNIGSIQTILANTKSKGSTLDDVNKALEQLNKYSDQTIYNFSEMARNIGTFTAAGVDLDTSVNAIKGIANLAALSGSNSQQAATAMYQLSQALAAGKVNLMDWNSVVNAGMGGELFKKALFETGKAMKTITDVPVGASFEEWEKKGGTFREQMEKGWLTADVLKTTLAAMSGDLDQSALMAKGFSAEAARGLVDLGKQGMAAATEVKTFTQLMGTVKESIGSGWATSFKIIVGDFEEAKTLFTSMGNAIGNVVNKFSDARNNLLQGWKNLGGRTALIEGLGNALGVVASILTRVGNAFREVFPAKTAGDLYSATTAFRDFFAKLQPSAETLNQLKAIFKGFFSALAIGKEIIRNIAQTFDVLFSNLARANSGAGGKFMQFLAEFAYKITHLKDILVDGGGIQDFFNKYIFPIANKLGSLNIAGPLESIIAAIKKFVTAIKDFFTSDEIAGSADNITSAVDRVGERFGWLQTVGEKLGNLGQWLASKLDKVADVFKDMLKKIAEVFSGTDTDAVFDALNAGLLAGLVAILGKFAKDGFQIDFGGGFMDNMTGALEQLTGTLDAMQKNLKAEALMKLAIAIGILTASVLVLSLIDSGALTKALIALGIGFGILIGAMAVLGKATDELGSFKMGAMATGLILLAAAVLVLSLAVKVLSTMDLGELAKGLIAVGLLLGMLTLAVNNMPDSGKMISSGIGMLAMSAALVVMATAVAILGNLETGHLIQGLVAVGVALAMLVIAVNKMPKKGEMIAAGVSMIAMGIALNIIASAVAIFGNMELKTLVQGMLAVAVAMAILVIAVNSFPDEGRLLATAAAMIAMGIALNIIAGAIAILGNMGLGDLIQGLIGLAAALLIITVAMAAMSGVVAGAAGMIIAAGAILILSVALKSLAEMSIGDIIIALVAVAAALAVITIAALLIQPALPALLGLGAALVVLGIGGALFGVAAFLIATAIGMIVNAIKELAEIGVEGVKVFAETLPVLAEAVGTAIVEIAKKLAAALPGLISDLGAAIGALIQVLIDNVPKLGELIGTLIQTLIKILRDNIPDLIAVGFEMIIALLKGISDNIGEITNTAVDIIVKFLNALTERADDLVTAGTDLLVAFIRGITENISKVIDAVGDLIVAFIDALSQQNQKIIDAGKDFIIDFISGFALAIIEITTAITDLIVLMLGELSKDTTRIMEAGKNFVVTFLTGLAQTTEEIVTAMTDLIVAFITAIDGNAQRVIDAGTTMVVNLINGIDASIQSVVDAVTNLVVNFINAIDTSSQKVIDAGVNLVVNLIYGIGGSLDKIVNAAVWLVGNFLGKLGEKAPVLARAGVLFVLKIMQAIGDSTILLANGAFTLVINFLNELSGVIERRSPELRAAGKRLAMSIIEGITGVDLGGISNWASNLGNTIKDKIGSILQINSPSKVMIKMGKGVVEGMAVGLAKSGPANTAAANLANGVIDAYSKAMSALDNEKLTSPVITPVLDLTYVKKDASALNSLISPSSVSASVSLENAAAILAARVNQETDTPEPTQPQNIEVKLEQNNYSPEALNAKEIYRQTRSLITQVELALETPERLVTSGSS